MDWETPLAVILWAFAFCLVAPIVLLVLTLMVGWLVLAIGYVRELWVHIQHERQR